MLTQEYIDTEDEVIDSGVALTPEVVGFAHLDDFLLLIEFDNGEKRVFDARPFLDRSPMSRQLLTDGYFRKAFCAGGTIEWPNGLNFCQDTFYDLGIPVDD